VGLPQRAIDKVAVWSKEEFSGQIAARALSSLLSKGCIGLIKLIEACPGSFI
jgi:hypothetical protein